MAVPKIILLAWGLAGIAMISHAQPLVIAHRGNSGAAPENTLAAVRSALELQPPPAYVEIDVHRTLDNVLVVSHDEDTYRTTGIRKIIREEPYEALKDLHASYRSVFGDLFEDERLPTLEQVLDTVAPSTAGVMIECKQLLLESDVLRLLRQRGELNRHIIASFDELTVHRAGELEPAVKTLYLVSEVSPTVLWRAKDIGAEILGVNGQASSDAVSAAHAKELQVWVWTVDEEKDILRWAEAGADGLITNRPAVARDVLARRTDSK